MSGARPPRGMRDLAPAEARKKAYVCETLIDVFETFAFEPLDTPALELSTTLMGKYGPDAERLIYRAGLGPDPDLALRYDLSVPLARFAATTEIDLPFRRYQIGKVWRGERPQRGRYREITQADVDIVGSSSLLADAEIIVVIATALNRLGFKGTITKLNNRQVLVAIGEHAGVPADLLPGLYRSIDKLDKIGIDGVRLELASVGLPSDLLQRFRQGADRWLRGTTEPDELRGELESVTVGASDMSAVGAYFDVLSAYPAGSGGDHLAAARSSAVSAAVNVLRDDQSRSVIPEDAIDRLVAMLDLPEGGHSRLQDLKGQLRGQAAETGFREIEAVLTALDAAGMPGDRVDFDPAMVRGLEYYTGTIFETVVTDPPIGSITGGGRFDGLTELFGRRLPAVGTSLGVDRLIDVMSEHDMFPPSVVRSKTQVLVTRFDEGCEPASVAVAAELRRNDICVELYLEDRGMGEQIRHALRRGTPLVVIVGPDELQNNTVALRDLQAGTQESVRRDQLVDAVRRRMGGGAR